MTCKANEAVALNTAETKKHFESKGIVALKADKTSQAPEIDALLVALGNKTTQIPFYALFPAGNRYQPETYSGLFVSENHFLGKIQGVKAKSGNTSMWLWVAAALVVGGAVLVFRKRRQPVPVENKADQPG